VSKTHLRKRNLAPVLPRLSDHYGGHRLSGDEQRRPYFPCRR